MSGQINIQCRNCKADHTFTENESKVFNKDNPFICTKCQIIEANKKKVLSQKSPEKELKKAEIQLEELKKEPETNQSKIIELEQTIQGLQSKQTEYQKLIQNLSFTPKEKVSLAMTNSIGIHWRKYFGLGILGLLVALGITSKALMNPALLRDLLIVIPPAFILWILVSVSRRKKQPENKLIKEKPKGEETS